jgi:hypothetical protein
MYKVGIDIKNDDDYRRYNENDIHTERQHALQYSDSQEVSYG